MSHRVDLHLLLSAYACGEAGMVFFLGEILPVAEPRCILQLPESLRDLRDHKEDKEEL